MLYGKKDRLRSARLVLCACLLGAVPCAVRAAHAQSSGDAPPPQTRPARIFSDQSPGQNATPQNPTPQNPTPQPGANPPEPAATVPQSTPAAAGKAHPPVEAIKLATPGAAALAARKNDYKISVTGEDWTDTHIVLAPPDHLVFAVSGTATLGDGRKVTPDGSPRGWKDLLRRFPANDAPVGALVGRIGTDPAVTAFLIGAQKALDVSTPGELFVRLNTSSDLPSQGSYEVKIKLSRNAEAASAAAVDVEKLVSPALFDNIPRRVSDMNNDPGDMVNYAIIGTQEQVTKTFANAGWVKVDKTTQDAIVHGLVATLSHESYTEMPMSTLYLFGRSQDLSYARADPIAVAAVRHHLRVWKTDQMISGRPLWVGSATHDNGFEKDQRNGGVTHHIDPEIDKERDFIEESFASAGGLAGAAYVLPGHPLQTAKTATGGSFQSDGRIVVLDLR